MLPRSLLAWFAKVQKKSFNCTAVLQVNAVEWLARVPCPFKTWLEFHWRSLTIPVLSRRRENTASLACRFFSQHWVTLTMSAASGPLCSFSSKQRSASSSRIRNGTCDAFRRSTSVHKHQAAWLVSAFNLWFPTPYARRGSLSLSLIIYIHL